MVDIRSAAAEIRRGKKRKKDRRKKEARGQKYNGLPYSTGRPSRRKDFKYAAKICPYV